MKKLLYTLITLHFVICISYSQKSNDFVESGRIKYFQKKYKEALKDFDTAIGLDPKNSEAYFCKGLLYDKSPELLQGSVIDLSNIDFVMDNFNIAIELNPNYDEAYFYRGLRKHGLGDYRGAIFDYDSAIKVYEKAIKTNKLGLDDYFSYRGMSASRLNDSDGALEDYNKAIEINPKNAFPYVLRGILIYNLGLKEEACLDFSKAGELGDKQSYEYIKKYCN